MEVLNYDNQGITELDASQVQGVDLSFVKTLILSRNKVRIVKANTFVNFTSLETLVLSSNLISVLEDGWTNGLKNLVTLDLSSNQLDTLGTGIFYGLLKLKTLFLNFNDFSFTSFENLPFLGLISLTNLHLSGNNFKRSIKAYSFASLFNIKLLNLNASNIKSIDSRTFPNAFGLCDLGSPGSNLGNTTINLVGNPVVTDNASQFQNTKCFSYKLF